MPERPRQCRPAGHVGLRQMLCHRAGRGGVAGRHLRQPHPEGGRPHPPLPSPVEERRRALGVHRLSRRAAGFLSGLGRRLGAPRPRHPPEAPAGRRHRPLLSGDDPLRRPRRCRPALARAPAEAHRHRPVQRKLPMADGEADQYRPGDRACAPRQLRRRARLRAAPSDRDAEHDLRSALRCRPPVRPEAVRHPRHAGHGGGEILPPDRARAVDRICRASSPASTASSIRTRASSSAATRSSRGASAASKTGSSPWRCTT